MWKNYKIMRKMATGIGNHNDIIDLKKYTNGSNWKNTNICVGISDINVSKNTSKIVSLYEKIDDNTFKLICYTDNYIYSNKIDDVYSWSGRDGDSVNYSKIYTGNFFTLGAKCGTASLKGNSYNNVSYRIQENGVWSSWFNILELNISNGGDVLSTSKLLQYTNIVNIEIKVNSSISGKNSHTNVGYSIYGGTKSSGNILQGKAEWLAYEN